MPPRRSRQKQLQDTESVSLRSCASKFPKVSWPGGDIFVWGAVTAEQAAAPGGPNKEKELERHSYLQVNKFHIAAAASPIFHRPRQNPTSSVSGSRGRQSDL